MAKATKSGNPAKSAAAELEVQRRIEERQVEMSTPTAAGAWNAHVKAEEGFVIELPSGNRARVRRTLDMPSLLASGRVPNPLAEILKEQIEGSSKGIKVPEFDEHEDAGEAAIQFQALIDQQMESIFIVPRVIIPPNDERAKGWTVPEGFISIDQLELQDKLYVYRFAQGGPLDLARFREESQTLMADILDGAKVSNAAEPDPEAV